MTTEAPCADGRSLLAFAHAGGSASSLKPLMCLVGNAISASAIELPGRGRRWREPAATTVASLLPSLTPAIEPGIDPILLGTSMGAYVAMALALHLQAVGRRPPPLLVAIANVGPDACSDPFEGADTMDDTEVLRYAERTGSVADPRLLADPFLRARAAAVFRADHALALSLVEACRGRVIDTPIVVISGTEDPLVSDEGLQAWRSATRGQVTFHQVPGGHLLWEESPSLVADLLCPLFSEPFQSSISHRKRHAPYI